MRQEDSRSSQLAELNLYFRFIERLSPEMKAKSDSGRTPDMCGHYTHAHILTNDTYAALRHTPKGQTAASPHSLVSPGMENVIFLQILTIKTRCFPSYFKSLNPDVFTHSTRRCLAASVSVLGGHAGVRSEGDLSLQHPELLRSFACISWWALVWCGVCFGKCF